MRATTNKPTVRNLRGGEAGRAGVNPAVGLGGTTLWAVPCANL